MPANPDFKKRVLAYVKKGKHDSYSARLVSRAFNVFEVVAREALRELEDSKDLMLIQTEPHQRWIASTAAPPTKQDTA